MNLTENFTLEEMVSSATASVKKIDNTPDLEQKEKLARLCNEILQPI